LKTSNQIVGEDQKPQEEDKIREKEGGLLIKGKAISKVENKNKMKGKGRRRKQLEAEYDQW
jgi:hypothetical protein